MSLSRVARTAGFVTILGGLIALLFSHHAHLRPAPVGLAFGELEAPGEREGERSEDAPRTRESKLQELVTSLREENERLTGRLEAIENTCTAETEALEQQVSALRERYAELEARLEASANELGRVRGEHNALLSERDSLQSEVSALRAQQATPAGMGEELDERMTELAGLVRRVQEATSGNAEAIARTFEELDQITRTNDRLALEITTQNDEMRTLRAKLSAAEATRAEAIRERDVAAAERDALRRELARANERASRPTGSGGDSGGGSGGDSGGGSGGDSGGGSGGDSGAATPTSPREVAGADLIEGTVALADNAAGLVAIDVGGASGIAAGMTFWVVRGGETIATLEVVKLRDRLAGCRIVERSRDIAAADRVTNRSPP
jgi:predicted  nucleic acid-binding Zn-ribbon protein